MKIHWLSYFLLIISSTLVYRADHYIVSVSDERSAVLLFVFSSMFVVVNILYSIFNIISTRLFMYKFEAAREFVRIERDNGSNIDFIIPDILKRNEALARKHFFAKSSWFNWYYDESILKVKPITLYH